MLPQSVEGHHSNNTTQESVYFVYLKSQLFIADSIFIKGLSATNTLFLGTMGKGGFITLINGTAYDWVKSAERSYQMHAWSFPNIPSGKIVTAYIEWDQGIFTNESHDAGYATFTLGNTGQNFELQALKIDGNFTLRISLANIATNTNSVGDIINLGFIHDGVVTFILSGSSGNFTSNRAPESWMQCNINTLGQRRLREICMPGSHNAGVNRNTKSTTWATESNCLCQSLSIQGQLLAGSRYFDIRPIIVGDEFSTGHYSDIPVVGWQGMQGQSMMSIIKDINDFTAKNHELVILNLSHSCNTHNYKSFTEGEWGQLFNLILNSLRGLFVAPSDTNLAELPLSKFIGENKASVLVVVDPNVSLGEFADHGFYSSSKLNIYDNYANTVNLGAMIEDQTRKMQSDDFVNHFFLLSWTLTQVTLGEVLTTNIRDLARVANKELYRELLPRCTKQKYPNVIFVDFIEGSRDISALAMAINTVRGP